MADAPKEEGGLVFHPMDQFIVNNAFGEMFLAVVATFALLVLGSAQRSIVPGKMQSVAELAYGFVHRTSAAKRG